MGTPAAIDHAVTDKEPGSPVSMRTHRTLATSAVVAISMGVALTLSGCFANPLDQLTDQIGAGIAEGGAEKLIEGATGADIDVESGQLPADFPTNVPLIDGEIVQAAKVGLGGGSTWSVTFAVDDVSASMDSAREQLLGAGFNEMTWAETNGMPMGMFEGETYGIILGGIDDDEDRLITYQVIERTEE